MYKVIIHLIYALDWKHYYVNNVIHLRDTNYISGRPEKGHDRH